MPEPIRTEAAETLELLDRWTEEFFDLEVRSIARVVLAAVLEGDPSVFKRSRRSDALAAAILGFLLRRLAGRMGAVERRGLPWAVSTQKEIAAATGVSPSTISSRSQTVANVVERSDIDWPSLLHSTQRREAMATKARIAEWRQGRA